MRAVMTIGLAALLTSPALAGGQQDDAPKPPKEKKICRSEQTTGSYFAKRTCHTREEWKAIDSSNGDDAHVVLDAARRQQTDATMR